MAQVFIQTLVKARDLFFIKASFIRESEKNFDYNLLPSEKLRYFDFTTRLHRLATTDSSFLCYFSSTNGVVYIFVFICTMRFQFSSNEWKTVDEYEPIKAMHYAS